MGEGVNGGEVLCHSRKENWQEVAATASENLVVRVVRSEFRRAAE